MGSVRELALAERCDFADLLDQLTADQWLASTSCAGWRVCDVVAHTVSYLGQSRASLAVEMVRAGGSIDRLNAQALEGLRRDDPKALVALMRVGAEPAGADALFGCRVALIECMVHQQDVRRPLGLERHIPDRRLMAVLRFAWRSPVIAGARRMRGIHLFASDLDWSAGHGARVTGPAEALLLAMTGRVTAVVDDLAGPGVRRLLQPRP